MFLKLFTVFPNNFIKDKHFYAIIKCVQMEWRTVQTLILYEQIDLGLHYLSTPVCLKKLDHYISLILTTSF